MRATVMRGGSLVVDDVADPTPGPGQLLVKTLSCGICGSDLHFLLHAEEMVQLGRELGQMTRVDLTKDLVMGHEFSAEVLDVGRGTSAPSVAKGDQVVSIPVMVTATFNASDFTGLETIGYSNSYPGGYGELMLLSSMTAIKIPNGLDPAFASLTEPMAVGAHAVNRSGIGKGEAALVLGAGPIGLAVISTLGRLGIEPIVAADFSQKRRDLALAIGAHEAIDPKTEPAIEAWRRVDGKLPLVIFEAVGVPGMIDQAMRDAPRSSRILIVGVCMESDTVRPMIGIGKELTISFALGYDPFEFASTLRAISEGELEVGPLITGKVGIDGVADAFDELGDPDRHCKIIVQP